MAFASVYTILTGRRNPFIPFFYAHHKYITVCASGLSICPPKTTRPMRPTMRLRTLIELIVGMHFIVARFLSISHEYWFSFYFTKAWPADGNTDGETLLKKCEDAGNSRYRFICPESLEPLLTFTRLRLGKIRIGAIDAYHAMYLIPQFYQRKKWTS